MRDLAPEPTRNTTRSLMSFMLHAHSHLEALISSTAYLFIWQDALRGAPIGPEVLYP